MFFLSHAAIFRKCLTLSDVFTPFLQVDTANHTQNLTIENSIAQHPSDEMGFLAAHRSQAAESCKQFQTKPSIGKRTKHFFASQTSLKQE